MDMPSLEPHDLGEELVTEGLELGSEPLICRTLGLFVGGRLEVS
jgi:hypothetical protein